MILAKERLILALYAAWASAVARFGPRPQREDFRPGLRGDIVAAISVGFWVGLVVTTVVLILIVSALIPQLNQGLANYSNNESVFGPILKNIVPIVLGAGILLMLVTVYLTQVRGKA